MNLGKEVREIRVISETLALVEGQEVPEGRDKRYSIKKGRFRGRFYFKYYDSNVLTV